MKLDDNIEKIKYRNLWLLFTLCITEQDLKDYRLARDIIRPMKYKSSLDLLDYHFLTGEEIQNIINKTSIQMSAKDIEYLLNILHHYNDLEQIRKNIYTQNEI
jgi:hypothetical protein